MPADPDDLLDQQEQRHAQKQADADAARGGQSIPGSTSTASSRSQCGEHVTPQRRGTNQPPPFIDTTQEDIISRSSDMYRGSLESTGSRRGIANVLVNVKNLTKTKLFRRLKHYKMAVSDSMKKKNASKAKFVRAFIKREIPDLAATEDDWKKIQLEITRTLRQKRCTSGQATAKIFHGKRKLQKYDSGKLVPLHTVYLLD